MATALSSPANQRRLSSPKRIASIIAKGVSTRRSQTRYAVGFGVKPLIFLHSVLPDRWFDALLRRICGMPS
ncbi:MAG: hypothetical protein H0U76_00745 [Ktedonobacteraceae bacterium]|nr:hypothetical protein [Ktedonobacteraceae bacterium]